MSGGKSQPTTQTTTYQLSPEQRQILDLAMPGLKSFAQNNPTAENIIPGFSGVAGFDPAQVAGQEAVLGSTGQQGATVGAAAQGNQFLASGAALDPNTNPALQGTINAAVRPITDQLLEKALPAIRSGAAMAGQYGGSRQGIAEGQAIRGAETAVGDTAAKVANQGYLSGLDAMTKNIGLAPQTAQSLALPGITTSGVGDVRQQLAQALLGEQTNRFSTSALWPLLLGKEYASMVSGIPGGGSTTTASGPQSNSLLQALGLGATALGGAGSFLSGAGAIAPFLLASDRRTKRVLRRLKARFRDLPLYVFEYLGSTLPRVGVMADEVPAYARLRFRGVDFVNYGAL